MAEHQQSSSSSSKMRSSCPLIPPLPSSKNKCLTTSTDKENASSSESTPFRSKTRTSLTTCTSKRTPLSTSRRTSNSNISSSRLPFRESTSKSAKNTSIRSGSPSVLSSATHKRDRVLRTAESMESLFMLSPSQSSPTHVQLCQDIVNGSRADDAAAWGCVLDVACRQVLIIEEQQGKDSAASSIARSDLMRLHRRAKARFSLFDGSTWMNENDKTTERHVVAIWLSYAEMQGKYTSQEEARATYRFMQNQYSNVQRIASFYLSLAKLESKTKPARAMEILTNGIQKGAKPVEDLRAALSALKDDSSIFRSPRVQSTTSTTQASPLLHPEQREAAMMPKIATVGRKRTAPRPIISPKRQRKVMIQMEKTDEFVSSTTMDDSNMSTGTVSLSLDFINDPNKLEQVEVAKPMSTCQPNGLTRIKKLAPLVGNEQQQAEPQLVPKQALSLLAERKVTSRVATSKARQPRSSLLAKVPRLKSAGLTGGAKRLSPEENNNTLSDSDDDAFDEPVQSKKEKTTASKPPALKLSKIDLSYMLNWDPTKRGTLTGDHSTTLNNVAPVSKSQEPSLGPVAETTEVGSSKCSSNAVTTSSHATSTASSHTGRSEQSNEDSVKSDLTGKQNSNGNTKSERAISPQEASLLAHCNTEFLPLVNENNIIRVNNIPYVKLGTIGKGGSSKVYRALSRNCSVLAIKKVKFGHLDKKAIDGYANEIALLKKLQGNPAIIQMYDSQVDMNRKAIFLAMELGEVDLSQVVQQQALQSSKNGNGKQQYSLNMNFIRLTWQQMLSAVHSIHEERIIHGDLKPANFLFVRGALKLIDFGIAKAIQSDDTNNIYRDSQIGTLNYMSPEAILDTGSGTDGQQMRIGRASDIWSLGCILYQMVYGRTPFASLHMIQKLQAIVNPAHKIDFPASVDDAAVDAIKRCLRRTAEQRPPIVGKGGLLNEHYFLNYHRTSSS